MTRRICIFLIVFAAGIAHAGQDLKNILITAAFEAGWESMDISKTSGENYSGVILESENGLLSISKFKSPGDAATHLDHANGVSSTFQQHPSKDVQLNNISYSITWQAGTYVYAVASAKDVKQVASIFYMGLDTAGMIVSPGSAKVGAGELSLPVDTVPSPSAAITALDVNGRTIKVSVSCRGLQADLLLHGQIRSLDTGKILQVVPILVPPGDKVFLEFVKPFGDWPKGEYKVSIIVSEDEIGRKRFSIP